MGLYVNPRTGSKQAWLYAHGKEVRSTRALVEYTIFRSSGLVPVVWVDNGHPGGAIGVAYSIEECRVFLANPLDEREKKVFVVKIGDLNSDAGITFDDLKDAGLT